MGDLTRIFVAALEDSRHRLALHLPEALLWVDGDLTRLAQVLSNLLNNAAKYTPPGGHISLSAQDEGGHVAVRVTDDGTGISADMLPRVFDLFAQAGGTLAQAQGGLGIGLSLVRQLVELHGGEVAAESAGLGLGSRFTVRLPLAAMDSARPLQPAVASATGSGGRPALLSLTRMVAVSPAFKLDLSLVMAIVGKAVSVLIVTELLTSEPSALKLPAASLKLALATPTWAVVVVSAVGVKVAV